MHATHFHPRHPVLLGVLALLLTLLVMAAIPADVGTLDFSLGGGATSGDGAAAATAVESTTRAAEPVWLQDPLASPLESLRAPAP